MQVAARTTGSILDEFRSRGLIHITDDGQELFTPGLDDLLSKEKVTAYIGFDPSADSLHIGNLLGIMMLVRMQKYGNTPIAIAGGGTGLIGDPGGKSEERPLLTREALQKNLEGIRAQLARFLDFDAQDNAALLVNNADWLEEISAIDFMRDVGKHFSVNYMLAKESVRSRMADGISYTEFSYMLLQAYDFLTLHDQYGCTLQMGGSDQWGNITAGVDLIRRVHGVSAHALVTPLVTKSDGTKFGKTEGGSVWLDAEKTSPFQFYQFWLNTADADVVRFLKYYTLIPLEELSEYEAEVTERPEKRSAQQRLASEVTRMTHGQTGLDKALVASHVLFGGEISGLSSDELLDIFQDVPSSTMSREKFEGEGLQLRDIVAEVGLASSRGEARRLIQGGGVSLNNRRMSDARQSVTLEHSVDGRVIVLRRGAKEYRLVSLQD